MHPARSRSLPASRHEWLPPKQNPTVTTAVYDGAPHSFFDRAYGDWADACADVWRRVLQLADEVAAD